jgi:hypothetical protein
LIGYATFEKSGVKKVISGVKKVISGVKKVISGVKKVISGVKKKYVMKIKKNVFDATFFKSGKNEILTPLNTWYIHSCTLKRENNLGKAHLERWSK